MQRVKTKKRKMIERTIYGDCGDVLTITSTMTEKEFIKFIKNTMKGTKANLIVI